MRECVCETSCRADLKVISRERYVVVCVHMETLLRWRTCVGLPVGVGAAACDRVCMCEVTWCVGPTLAYFLKAGGNSDTWPRYVTPE